MTTTLLRGGSVYSPADPFATALVVEDGTVAWVGGGDAADLSYRDAVDEVIELDGALVTPAFVDAHVHATSTGLTLGGLDLAGCSSLAEALGRLERHAAARPGAVVLGHGWDETGWPEGRPPTAAELDRAGGGARVYLARVDVHSAVASPALLDAVPQVRSAAGFEPTGRVAADAHHLVRRAALALVPPAQRQAAQRTTRARAAAAGIGCLHELGGPDISSEDDFARLLALARSEPGPDVLGYWGELLAVDKAAELGAVGAAGDLFVDGALGSHTAALHEPYADTAEASHGQLYLETEQIAAHLEAATRAGQQAGFHCIGDAAVDAVVTALGQVAHRLGQVSVRAARHRLEHVEMAGSTAVATLAALGVVASVQPGFDAAWGGEHGMYAQRLGAARAGAMNPFAAMAAAGVPLAFGSDSPVTPLDPWGAVRAAVHHSSPRQRLTARAAFAAHTRGGWRAAGRDDGGVLVPGAPATYAVWHTRDLVVQAPDERVAGWSTDPASGVPGLPDLTPGTALPSCLRTVVRGQTVFTREGALE